MLELGSVVFRYDRLSGAATEVGEPACTLSRAGICVHPGERVGLLGPNGSGKSTLLRCACGQLAFTEGTLCLDGKVVERPWESDLLARSVGYVGQDPDDQMVASTLYEEVAFGPCNLGLPAAQVRTAVEGALAACNLLGFEDRDVATLSGGQRQRAALAGVVAMNPSYLLLDEPCSMLDPVSRREVGSVVDGMARRGCGVIHVTHDYAEIADYDRIVVMRAGCTVWEGTPDAFAADAEAQRVSACLNAPSSLFKGNVCEKHAARDWSREPLLRLSGVAHAYRTGVDTVVRALDGVDLDVFPGEVVLVAGRTGSGKSTLARVASGLLSPTDGSAVLRGEPVRPGLVGHAFQRAEDQLFAATVLEDISFGPLNMGASSQEAEACARRAMELVGLDADTFGSVSPFALSGGQMRRVALAGVLAMETPVVVLDEPTVGLDALGVERLARIIAALVEEGRSVVLVTHDVDVLAPLADRVVGLDGGRVVRVENAEGREAPCLRE